MASVESIEKEVLPTKLLKKMFKEVLEFVPFKLKHIVSSSNIAISRYNNFTQYQRFQRSGSFSTSASEVPSSASSDKSSLTLTDSCISRLRQILTKDQPYLRISISGGGCSGFQYGFELDSTIGPDDRLIEDGNGTTLVVVDSTSLSYISGSTVDYYEELIRTGFRIISNPQADGGCSCGSSFSIKM